MFFLSQIRHPARHMAKHEKGNGVNNPLFLAVSFSNFFSMNVHTLYDRVKCAIESASSMIHLIFTHKVVLSSSDDCLPAKLPSTSRHHLLPMSLLQIFTEMSLSCFCLQIKQKHSKSNQTPLRQNSIRQTAIRIKLTTDSCPYYTIIFLFEKGFFTNNKYSVMNKN